MHCFKLVIRYKDKIVFEESIGNYCDVLDRLNGILYSIYDFYEIFKYSVFRPDDFIYTIQEDVL